MHKRNFLLVISILLLGVFLLSGCGAKDNNKKEVTGVVETRVVTDVLGRKVEVSTDIKSIAVAPIPYTSMVYAIDGSGEKLEAIHPSAKAAYEMSILKKMAPEIENVSDDYIGADFSINIEEILNLKPDLMILWSRQEEEIKKLEDLGIPVIALTNGANSNIDEFHKNIDILGKALGKEKKAEELISYHEDVMDYFKSKADQIDDEKKPRVLYLKDPELNVSASDSFNQIMIEMAGGVNAANEVKGSWTQVSMEQILEWDPEIIYLSNFDDFAPEDLYENRIKGQDWSNVSAVKNKNVFKTPLGIYRWDAPNAETHLFLKWMGQKQQPGVFSKYNFEEDLRSFYKQFFNYDLTKQEIDAIVNKKHNK